MADKSRKPKGRFPLRKISMRSDSSEQNRTRAWAFGTNFLFQFEPVIRNPDDKELKYFQLFFGPAVWIIQDGKKSSPIRCLFSCVKTGLNRVCLTYGRINSVRTRQRCQRLYSTTGDNLLFYNCRFSLLLDLW